MFNAMARRLNISEKEISDGTAIEMEHTNDPTEARKIALDHLKESPKYYTYLEKMEKEMPKH